MLQTSRLVAALHANAARSTSTVPSWPPPKSSASLEDYTKEDIEQIRARIFCNHVGDGSFTGLRKIAAMGKLQTHTARYYPTELMTMNSKRALPFWSTDWYEERQEKLAQRRRRGKYVPKKGQGKRTGKKKGR